MSSSVTNNAADRAIQLRGPFATVGAHREKSAPIIWGDIAGFPRSIRDLGFDGDRSFGGMYVEHAGWSNGPSAPRASS